MGCGGRGCEWLPRRRTLPMPILGAIRVTSGEIGARCGWPWGGILKHVISMVAVPKAVELETCITLGGLVEILQFGVTQERKHCPACVSTLARRLVDNYK